MLRLRLPPQAALELLEGLEIEERSPVIDQFAIRPGMRFAVAVFSSEGCRLCRGLRPAIAVLERDAQLESRCSTRCATTQPGATSPCPAALRRRARPRRHRPRQGAVQPRSHSWRASSRRRSSAPRPRVSDDGSRARLHARTPRGVSPERVPGACLLRPEEASRARGLARARRTPTTLCGHTTRPTPARTQPGCRASTPAAFRSAREGREAGRRPRPPGRSPGAARGRPWPPPPTRTDGRSRCRARVPGRGRLEYGMRTWVDGSWYQLRRARPQARRLLLAEPKKDQRRPVAHRLLLQGQAGSSAFYYARRCRADPGRPRRHGRPCWPDRARPPRWLLDDETITPSSPGGRSGGVRRRRRGGGIATFGALAFLGAVLLAWHDRGRGGRGRRGIGRRDRRGARGARRAAGATAGTGALAPDVAAALATAATACCSAWGSVTFVLTLAFWALAAIALAVGDRARRRDGIGVRPRPARCRSCSSRQSPGGPLGARGIDVLAMRPGSRAASGSRTHWRSAAARPSCSPARRRPQRRSWPVPRSIPAWPARRSRGRGRTAASCVFPPIRRTPSPSRERPRSPGEHGGRRLAARLAEGTLVRVVRALDLAPVADVPLARPADALAVSDTWLAYRQACWTAATASPRGRSRQQPTSEPWRRSRGALRSAARRRTAGILVFHRAGRSQSTIVAVDLDRGDTSVVRRARLAQLSNPSVLGRKLYVRHST